MPRKVTVGLIQTHNPEPNPQAPLSEDPEGRAGPAHASSSTRPARRASRSSACRRSSTARTSARRRTRSWYDAAEPVPGPDDRGDREGVAKKYQMAMVVPRLRARGRGRLLQHRRRASTPTARTSASTARTTSRTRSGFWEKYFFKPGQPRLPRLPDALREGRRLHLLRPPLPRGRARPRAERRRDRLQPVGDGRGPLAVPLEARAARARGRERLLRRGVEPRRHRGAVEHRQVLRHVVLRRPARQLPRDGERGQGRARRRDVRPRPDRGGPPDLAVLPGPPAGDVRHARRRSEEDRREDDSTCR